MEETILGIFIALLLYMLPGIIAFANNKKNTTAIVVLNLLTGWTGIGWVVSLVWALTKG